MRVYVLLGQGGELFSWGMVSFASRLRTEFPESRVTVGYWSPHQAVVAELPQHETNVIIGYSLGANAISWIARDTDVTVPLAVAYDPSVNSPVYNPIGSHFQKVLNYRNTLPDLFGRAVMEGPTVEDVPIRIPHLLVQVSPWLHDRTVAEMRLIENA